MEPEVYWTGSRLPWAAMTAPQVGVAAVLAEKDRCHTAAAELAGDAVGVRKGLREPT